MEILEIVGSVIAFLIYALLLYQQNQIMQETNRIMVEQGGAQVATRHRRFGRYWPMLVMGLLTILTWSAIGFYYSLHAHREGDWKALQNEAWNRAAHDKTEVIDKVFQNERVLLDGHSYRHCRFTNVTFVFKGDAPFDLESNQINGSRWVDVTDSEQLTTLVNLLGELKLLQNVGIMPTPSQGDK